VLQPVGPLPASVYWRRRAVVLAAVLLVVLLLWAVWPSGGDGGGRRDASAGTSAPSPSGTPAELAATPPANDPGRAADPGTGGSAATGGPSGTGATGGTGGGDSTSGTAGASTGTPPAAPAGPCADGALQLRVLPQQPSFRVGTRPRINLTVRNVSSAACTRDLGAAQQEILLYRGSTRLWSSNDCYPQGDRAVRTLAPGESVTSSVVWSGLSSQPACAGTRTRVGAGTYDLVGRLATLTTPRARITLT
jgi:hypothetical protein